MLDCFIPKFELKYVHFENIKNKSCKVVFNLLQIKQSKFFWEHPVTFEIASSINCYVKESFTDILREIKMFSSGIPGE